MRRCSQEECFRCNIKKLPTSPGGGGEVESLMLKVESFRIRLARARWWSVANAAARAPRFAARAVSYAKLCTPYAVRRHSLHFVNCTL